jgi:hypothetical protein
MNKSTLDETHDETQIFLSCSPITTPFKPFTKFIINISEINEDGTPILDDNGQPIIDTLYRVVIADEITQVVFEDVEDKNGNIVDGLYDHDIRLAEATKELERYTVDNLSFTNEWRKAFQSNEAGFFINSSTYGRGWYDFTGFRYYYKSSGGTGRYYYPNMFKTYNSRDYGASMAVDTDSIPPDRPAINETYIARTLTKNNYAEDFEFDRKVKDRYLLNTTMSIPNLNLSPMVDITLASNSVNHFLLWKINTTYYAQFRQGNITITMTNPNGEVQIVNGGDIYSFNLSGRYRLKYLVTRQVRIRDYAKNTMNDNVYDNYSPWYDGITTELEFDIVCSPVYNESTKLTIYDILEKLVQTTPTRYNTNEQPKFQLYRTLRERYDTVSAEAPEMIFTNKNLWEALREIGGVINAIPFLNIQDKNNWNFIDFLPLSSEEQVSDEVEDEYCNSTSYYDSENYTASYDLSVDNMINPISTKEGAISEAGYKISKSIRSEEVEISETSMNIETVYPIYKVDSVKYINYSLPTTEIDLTTYVVEEALYNTMVSNNVNTGKQLHIYYTQGKKNIKGLQFKVSKNEYKDAENKIAIKQLIEERLLNIIGRSYSLSTDEILKGKFIVKYVPFLNARIKIYKPNAPKLNIDTTMFQNQSANVLDAVALGRKMVANIGRVGNLGYVDSIKVYSLNKIPLKGQRSRDGYFVSTVTTEYDQHHLLSSVQYTKDYQKISDFVNIQNLQRFFEVSEKQSVHRYINTRMFYLFYGNDISIAEINKEKGLNQANGYPQVNYLASLLVDQGYNRKINASILTAYTEQGGDEYVCSKVYLNTNALAIGNTISLITDYNDNYGAGYQAVPYQETSGGITTNAYMNRAVPYSDSLGKIKHLEIMNITDSNIVYPSGNTELENNISKLAMSLPAISNIEQNTLGDIVPVGEEFLTIADNYQNDNKPTFSLVGCKQDINTLKDSREILHFNQQHHFLSADDNIVVGSAMTESCRFIQENTTKCRLVFLNNKIDSYEYQIKEENIIDIILPTQQELQAQAQILIDLCTEITSANLSNILSTTNNTDALYLLPNLENGGAIVGLSENAKAWAIITDENRLIIGKNEDIQKTENYNYYSATRINMSVTSEY